MASSLLQARMAYALGFLVFWACSGSDNVTGPEDGSNPPSQTVTRATFSSIQSTVFTPTCALSGCHSGAQRPNLTAGQAYNNIVNVASTQGIDYIEPGDPDNSYLYRKLTGNNIVGTRMPRGRTPLAQAVLDSIRVWIERGAPNN